AGFVGTNLINRLLSVGADVRATTHSKQPAAKDDRVEYVTCDLMEKEDCWRVADGVDYVFMCAANTSGAGVMAKTPLVHVTPNILMNTLLLDAAYAAGVKKFLFLSSNTVYPAVEHPVREDEMVPGDVFEKYYCVAWMKQFTEVLCRMYAEKIPEPMKTVVVRPANIYGPHDDFEWETSHVLPIEVWGDGNDIKDFIYIDDFVDGMLLAMEKIDTFDPVNIASGVPCSIKQALQAIIDADGYTDARIVFDAAKPTMIPKRLIDASRAKQLLGFEAKTSISDGIRKTTQWYRSTRPSQQCAHASAV
ncbi:MAG: NAD-dependent epimerase/dehydratase family protein, partial [Planctomycetota bacterium]